jgi:hypothetical protein
VSETHQGKAPQDSIIHNNVEPVREMASMPPATGPNVTQFKSFEEIYGTVPSKLAGTYGILKVAAMTRSPHLTQMSAESKRAALLMALEAAGVDIEDVLQDAMLRQRALNSYEEAQCQRMQEFEEGKLRENANIQAELDRLTAQYMSRIQINLDAVAREQDALRAWQKRKQQEGQRIAEAAGFSVPPEAGAGSSLPAVVERIRSRPAAASGG